MGASWRAWVAAVLVLAAVPLRSEIQWLNGGLPEGQASSDSPGVVRDAPDLQSRETAPDGNGPILCHLTTCTRLMGQYPADSVNYFYLNKHTSVVYFAYFLMKPSTRIHTAVVDWFNPAGGRIARYEQEFRVSFTDRLLTVGGETYQWFLVTCSIGIGSPLPEVHQTGLPRDPGLYSANLTVDGVPAGITFFYIKNQEPEPAKASGAAAPAPAPSSAMPLNTPTSSAPLVPARPKP